MADVHLVRLEAKIDKLSEAMLTLVRMEERMLFQANTIEKLEAKVERLTEQKDLLKDSVHDVQVSESGSTSRNLIVERIIWTAVSAGLGLIGYSAHAPDGVIP